MSIPFSQFYRPHQPEEPVKVEPGKSAVIYQFDIPSDFVAFIWDLGLDSWYPNTYWIWEIDNEKVEKIERKIGEVKKPYKFRPRPYYAEKQIKFTAYNNDTKAHYFDILCDGELFRKIT